MMRYEALFLTVPEITKSEMETIEKQLNDLVIDAHGEIISFERWGKYRLAYPVAKNEYGVYYLTRFQVGPEHTQKLLSELKNFLDIKYGNLVKRTMVSVLPVHKSLEYQRPESLEETPQDVDDFLRKNKMGAFVGKSGASFKKPRTSKQEPVEVGDLDETFDAE
ncbi:MAG TPA: 30S ribosomal protein S6 [Candidatus Babeliales bacterium]|nr:30S ribosomal protein S6 [Candidatus Babeliales bacterium]